MKVKFVNVEAHSDSYLQAIKSSMEMNGLSEQTMSIIHGPQLLFVTDEYRSAPIKVMVIGQEIGDTDKSLVEAAAEGMDSLIQRQNNDFKKFDFDANKDHARSPFWHGFDEVCETFSLPSRRSIAWSNVSKVQISLPSISSVSISNLPAAQQMEIIRWQSVLTRAEIAYAKPDIIIHFTGKMTWMLYHLYSSNTESLKSDVIFTPLAGATKATGIVQAPLLNGIISVFTHHPNGGRTFAGRQRTMDERKLVLEWAINKFNSNKN